MNLISDWSLPEFCGLYYILPSLSAHHQECGLSSVLCPLLQMHSCGFVSESLREHAKHLRNHSVSGTQTCRKGTANTARKGGPRRRWGRGAVLGKGRHVRVGFWPQLDKQPLVLFLPCDPQQRDGTWERVLYLLSNWWLAKAAWSITVPSEGMWTIPSEA